MIVERVRESVLLSEPAGGRERGREGERVREVSSALLMVSIDSTSTLNDDFMYNISCSGINQLS